MFSDFPLELVSLIKCHSVVKRNRNIILLDYLKLAITHIRYGILDTKARNQKSVTTAHTEHHHPETLPVSEHVSNRHLTGELKPLPYKSNLFKEYALTVRRSLRSY